MDIMGNFFRRHKHNKPKIEEPNNNVTEEVINVVEDIDNFFSSNEPLLDPSPDTVTTVYNPKTIDDCDIALDNAKTIDDVECTGMAINSKINDLVTDFQIAINKELSDYVEQRVNDEEEELRGKVGRYYTVDEVVQLNQFKIDCIKTLTQIEQLIDGLGSTLSKLNPDNCEYLKSPIKVYLDNLNKLCKEFKND